MKPDKSVDRLEEDYDPYRQCPTLIDISVVDGLLAWLNDHIEFYEKIETRQVRLGILQRHVDARPDSEDLKVRIQSFDIQLLEFEPNADDERLITEMLRAYFGDNSKYRKAAQLLAYARQYSEDSDDAQIVSQLRIFRYIPNVQLYFVPNIAYRALDDDLVYQRIVDALEIDSRIWNAAEQYIRLGKYRGALYEVANAYFSELRRLSGESSDGRNLVDKTLSPLNGNIPLININEAFSDLDSDIAFNDQRGYYELACGITAGVRNLVSHPKDEAYLQKRFGKQSIVLKFLGLFSLLTERLPK